MHEPLSLIMSLRQLSQVKVGRDQKQYAARHVAVHVVGAPGPFDSGCIIFAQLASDCHIIHEPIVGWETGICFERALAIAEALIRITSIDHGHAEQINRKSVIRI